MAKAANDRRWSDKKEYSREAMRPRALWLLLELSSVGTGEPLENMGHVSKKSRCLGSASLLPISHSPYAFP